MKRIEKIYLFVSKQSKALSREEVASGAGITTKEVAEAFGIQRTNASKDLNELVKDGLLAKIDGRPVRYLECGLVSQTKQSQLKKTPIPIRSKKEYVDILKNLSNLLGKTSLEGQISEIELTKNFLETQIKKAEEEERKNKKMYRSLGVILGLVIVIILI